jgi:hypothetical protein
MQSRTEITGLKAKELKWFILAQRKAVAHAAKRVNV